MARSANLEWNHVSDDQLGKLAVYTHTSYVNRNLCYNCTEKNDLADLCSALTPIASKWDSFALQLGVPHETTQTIEVKNFHNPTKCLKDALSEWLDDNYDKTRHGHQSWRKVCKATANQAGGNNKALANKIAAKHPVQQHGAGQRQISN